MPTRNSRKALRGFTLVEVMVSLVIMALIATVAFAGLNIGIDSWTRGAGKIDQLDQRAAVERLLKRQLAVAYPLELPVNVEGPAVIFFRGTSMSVEFIADYSLADGPTDFRKIGYEFRNGDFRYEEKNLLGYVPQEFELIDGEILAAFSDVRFSYLPKALPGATERPSWSAEWKIGDGLPAAVRVHLAGDSVIIPLVNTK